MFLILQCITQRALPYFIVILMTALKSVPEYIVDMNIAIEQLAMVPLDKLTLRFLCLVNYSASINSNGRIVK